MTIAYASPIPPVPVARNRKPATPLALALAAQGIADADAAEAVGLSAHHFSLVKLGRAPGSKAARKLIALLVGMGEAELWPWTAARSGPRQSGPTLTSSS